LSRFCPRIRHLDKTTHKAFVDAADGSKCFDIFHVSHIFSKSSLHVKDYEKEQQLYRVPYLFTSHSKMIGCFTYTFVHFLLS
jgi:hypothetical protein